MFQAAQSGAEFQHRINQTAIVGGRALGRSRKDLEAFARGLDRQFTKTPTEIAAAMFENTKAGLSAGLEMITKYQIAVATATDEALEGEQGVAAGLIGIMNAMDMRADEFPRIANAVTAAANSTNASVLSLNESMQYFANTAHIAGLSLEETLALIGKLSQSKIMGSAAGTALSNMVQHAVNSVGMFQSPKNKKAWAAMGIDPNVVVGLINQKQGGLFKLVEYVDKATKGMERQKKLTLLNQIFGVRGEKAMINLFGSADPTKTFKGILESIKEGVKGDVAMAQSKAMMNDLYSDIKFLGNAFNDLKIALSHNPIIRVFIGILTKAVRVLTAIADTKVGGVLIGLASIASVLGLTLFGFRAAALSATLALNSLSQVAAAGGFRGLMASGLDMIAGTTGINGKVATNKAGRMYVKSGTVSHGGKTYSAGRLLPKAFGANSGAGQAIGSALGAASGVASFASFFSKGGTFFGKALPMLGSIVGFGLKWLPIIGTIWTIADLLNDIFGFWGQEKTEKDAARDEYNSQMRMRHQYDHLRDVDPSFDATQDQWEKKYGNSVRKMNQNIIINLNGQKIYEKEHPLHWDRDREEEVEFSMIH
jgi:TP901 family phage tail tape measure protein